MSLPRARYRPLRCYARRGTPRPSLAGRPKWPLVGYCTTFRPYRRRVTVVDAAALSRGDPPPGRLIWAAGRGTRRIDRYHHRLVTISITSSDRVRQVSAVNTSSAVSLSPWSSASYDTGEAHPGVLLSSGNPHPSRVRTHAERRLQNTRGPPCGNRHSLEREVPVLSGNHEPNQTRYSTHDQWPSGSAPQSWRSHRDGEGAVSRRY